MWKAGKQQHSRHRHDHCSRTTTVKSARHFLVIPETWPTVILGHHHWQSSHSRIKLRRGKDGREGDEQEGGADGSGLSFVSARDRRHYRHPANTHPSRQHANKHFRGMVVTIQRTICGDNGADREQTVVAAEGTQPKRGRLQLPQ